MDKLNKQIQNNSESAHKVNLIIILLSITMFLIIGVASIGFSLTNNNGSSDLKDFINGVTVKDAENNPIEDGTLYVGEKYHIQLQFQEKGAQGIQFTPTEGNQLTYQIPSTFKVETITNASLKVTINNQEVEVGTYSIDENGLLTIQLNENGKQALESSTDVSFKFDITVTAQPNTGEDDGKVHFGDVESNFNFDLTNDAKVDVDKIGFYTEDAKGEDGKDPSGGTLSYTVKATVEHGEVHNAIIKDVLTLPNNPNFKFHLQEKDSKPDVIVTLKRIVNGEEEIITLTESDYELIQVKSEPDSANANQSFEVKIKAGSQYNPLKDGDIVEVKYNYRVDYGSGGEFFWDTVKNEAEVQGTYKIKDPTTDIEEEKSVEEHKKNETSVFRTPVGGGKVVKGQEYDQKTKKLHYTVYAIAPKGDWNPFFLTDQINVTIDGVNYSLKEFKNGGRIDDISVSALDLNDEQKKMTDSYDNGTLVDKLKEIQSQAKTLKGFDFDNLKEYDPKDMDQYVYKKEDSILHIIFGLQKDEQDGNNYWGRWGHYHNEKDRLIIIEYNLNLADGNVNLTKGQNEDTVSKPIDDVLHAGITNDINFRYGGYYPGYTTFYTNAEKIVKEGIFDKKTNTVDYTVTLNITDAEIREYLKSITNNWINEVGEKNQWDYEKSMKAEFYDILPEGWEYVDDSLEAIVVDKWQEKRYPYCETPLGSPAKEVEIEGQKRNVISAAIIYFKYTDEKSYHELYAENFGNDNVKSITFHYKLKPSESWLKEHASEETTIKIHNKASIKDKDNTKWTAETDVDYYPVHLYKEAKQDDSSNLMHFTLRINPYGVKLNKSNNNFLVVNDTSVGMQIQMESIKVLDSTGNELTKKDNITLNENITESEWGLLSTEDENNRHFRLKVPDSKALTITYDALIEKLGENVEVSNTASIDGVAESDTEYQGSLHVENIYGSGDGSAYELTFEKVDQDDVSKKLKDAKFDFYIVKSEKSDLETTETITINGNSYECHRESNWSFTTNDKGQYKIEKKDNWNLEPGNYYIIKEVDAPEGYMPSDPILFYYGMPGDMDQTKGSLYALPNGKLTIKNEPVPYHIPATGGIGLKIFYTIGFLLTVLSISLIWRRIRLKPTK